MSVDRPVDNAPYLTFVHGGLTVEGWSRAAVQSYWRMPELKLGFDLGAQPWDFMGTPTWFVSHTHLDHIAALPVYVARRRMMKMEPPTIYVPHESRGGRREAPDGDAQTRPRPAVGDLRASRPGDEIELSREHVVTVSTTVAHHPVAGASSSGNGATSSRRSTSVCPARRSATCGSRASPSPGSAFPASRLHRRHAPGGLDNCPACYEAKILITEMSFVRRQSPPRQDPQVRAHAPGRLRRAGGTVPRTKSSSRRTSARATTRTRCANCSRTSSRRS